VPAGSDSKTAAMVHQRKKDSKIKRLAVLATIDAMTRTNTPITVADVARHAGPPAMGFQHLPRCPTRPPRWFSSRRRQKNHGRATAAACQQLADRRRLDFRRCPADRCRQAAIDLWLLFMLRAQAARTCKVAGVGRSRRPIPYGPGILAQPGGACSAGDE
jgi:hypothetical protein